MNIKTKFISLLSLAVLVFSCSEKETADLLIMGGRIYTMVEDQPIVEAVAVTGNKIIKIGNEADVKKIADKNTRFVDLKGRTMTPGFIEGHGHIMGIGYAEMNLDLTATDSFEDIVNKVKAAVEQAEPGEWIIGRGWHQDKWGQMPAQMIKGFPLHHQLSQISPENPVFLYHASGHAAFANAKAMEIAKVNQLEAEKLNTQVEGGEIIRDELGNPTGLFNERAMYLISKHIPADDSNRNNTALELAIKACLRNGITSFHDAGASRKDMELFRQFKTDGKLHTRLYVMVSGEDGQLINDWLENGPEIDPDGFLTIRSIKLHCDGALGSRGAWLLQPYSDAPGNYGMPTMPMDSVLMISREALKQGFQVCSHAIGDRTNREILDKYEVAFRENPSKSKDHRFRIEHAQHLHPDDILRFAALGVLPAMQAIHMSSDRPWAIERLGEKRIVEGAYMWQSLLKSGAKVINGTDAPVEPLNPIPSFYASVTRKTLKGEPENGYEPKERMTREQALRSYTLDAAYGAFEEHIKGSIEPGKLADFTVFSKNIMEVPESELLDTEVIMTIVGGEILFQKE